jgi:hypothetical protein
VADDADDQMMDDARPDGDARRPRARGMRAGARALGRPVALEGLAQVVGLALGAPEFQRR